MSFVLALDLGTRRTGVAFGDDVSEFVVALDTIAHQSTNELIDHVGTLAKKKKATRLIVGLPRLLDGTEGSQAVKAREVGKQLEEALKLPIEWVDERFTTASDSPIKTDPDAQSACALLEVALRRRKRI